MLLTCVVVMAARWTLTENRTLRGHYDAGVSLRLIADRLGRSESAVRARRRALGISPRDRVREWTSTEDTQLRASSASGVPVGAVAQRLGRPAEQVRRRRRRLMGSGPSPRPYSAAEDDRLRNGWADGASLDALARGLGRSAGSVRLRAQKLGLHRPPGRRRWLPAEDAILRDGYEQGLSCAQIAVQLPGRSEGTVPARAARLGIATYARAWSQVDDHRLRVLVAEGLPVDSVAQALGRTPQAIAIRTSRLAVALTAARVAPRAALRWTAWEDEVLRVHAALNPAILAELLGRSSCAVVQRMRRLKVRQGASPHHPVARRGALTPGEAVTAVRELRARGPGRAFAVARRMEVSPTLIRAAATRSAQAGAALASNHTATQ